MTKRFQIVEIYPVYHHSTDGIIGSNARRLPNAYETEALAHKIAGRLHDADYEACGDSSFRVIPWGGDVWNPVLAKAIARSAEFDEIPF